MLGRVTRLVTSSFPSSHPPPRCDVKAALDGIEKKIRSQEQTREPEGLACSAPSHSFPPTPPHPKAGRILALGGGVVLGVGRLSLST